MKAARSAVFGEYLHALIAHLVAPRPGLGFPYMPGSSPSHPVKQ